MGCGPDSICSDYGPVHWQQSVWVGSLKTHASLSTVSIMNKK